MSIITTIISPTDGSDIDLTRSDNNNNNDNDDDDDYLLLRSPMLRRYPSFVPLRRHATSIAQVSFLVPAFGSPLREASVSSAAINMTMTIVGGGVISIPLSCSRAGIIPFTILMILSAIITDFSLYLLCSAARRTGSTSFGLVARKAIGPELEFLTTILVFVEVTLMNVGLMILNAGIWSPIVWICIRGFNNDTTSTTTTTTTTTRYEDGCVLLVCVVLMIPFLLKQNLTSLRHMCYISFASIAILCLAMVYRSVELNLILHPNLFRQKVKWIGSTSDIISSLPIVLLAFICSYNMIGVHCSLIKPTPERVRLVIHKAVRNSFILMYIFGLAGYLWSYDQTVGNILLNFDPTDKIIFVGRIGCGISTLFALPITLLPSREALLSLMAQISEIRYSMRTNNNNNDEEKSLLLMNGTTRKDNNNISSFSSKQQRDNNNMISPYNTINNDTKKQSSLSTTVTKNDNDNNDNGQFLHILTTITLTCCCYCAAVVAPGVAIVWDFAGSSLCFLIQFIIPAICYIALKRSVVVDSTTTTTGWYQKLKTLIRTKKKRLLWAWILLLSSIVGAVLCTYTIVQRYI